MSIFFIITGVVFVVLGLALPPPAAEAPKEKEPQSCELRIVQTPSGEYEIEIYNKYPAWLPLMRDLKTLDEAQRAMEHLGRVRKVVQPTNQPSQP